MGNSALAAAQASRGAGVDERGDGGGCFRAGRGDDVVGGPGHGERAGAGDQSGGVVEPGLRGDAVEAAADQQGRYAQGGKFGTFWASSREPAWAAG